MGFYSANTTELQSKLSIMYLCSKLLLALVDTEDENIKKEIMTSMINMGGVSI
jgi:hypothetical protein